MGREHVATYDTFTWAPAIPAVVANADRGTAAQPEVPAEDKYHLETVFAKFDAHFGVHRYRSIKRQDFLSCTRGPKQSVQSFISDLGDKVSMLTHIYPHKARRKIEVIICKITRLTAHFMCGLMSDLLICTCL